MTDQEMMQRILATVLDIKLEVAEIRAELADKPSRQEMRVAINDARAEAKTDNRALREELYAFRADITSKVDVLREHFDAFIDYADQTYVKKAPAR